MEERGRVWHHRVNVVRFVFGLKEAWKEWGITSGKEFNVSAWVTYGPGALLLERLLFLVFEEECFVLF